MKWLLYICIYKVSQSIISHITTQIFEALQVITGEAIMYTRHRIYTMKTKQFSFQSLQTLQLGTWTQHLLGLVSEDLKGWGMGTKPRTSHMEQKGMDSKVKSHCQSDEDWTVEKKKKKALLINTNLDWTAV